MRGIAPHGSSIVLSGGYVDHEDLGDVIIYTGEGGRDPNTGRQIADQQLISGNLALAENPLRMSDDLPEFLGVRSGEELRVSAHQQRID